MYIRGCFCFGVHYIVLYDLNMIYRCMMFHFQCIRSWTADAVKRSISVITKSIGITVIDANHGTLVNI